MKIDLPSSNPTVLTQYNRYIQLYLQLSKTSSELSELAGLSTALASYITTASDINAFTNHLSDYTLQVPYIATTGSANVYVATLSPALTSYVAGVAIAVNINITNTGASTINVNGLGAKNILTSKGAAMSAGKLTASGVYTLRYNGTNFILQGEGGDYGTAGAAQVLTGYTVGQDTGIVNGSMANIGALGTITPTTTSQSIPSGFISSGTVAGDANLTAANLPLGMTMFGLTGTGTNVKRFATGNVTAVNGTLTVNVLAFQPSLLMIYNNGVLSTTTMREYGALANAASDFNNSFGASYNSRGTQKNNSNADIMTTANNATFNANGFVFNMQPFQSPYTDTLKYWAFQ